MTTGRTRSKAFLLALLLVTLAACSGSGSKSQGANSDLNTEVSPRPTTGELAPDQVLRVNSFGQLKNFDPAKLGPTTTGAGALGRQYTEPLLIPRPGTAPPYRTDGAAAEKFDVSSDELTYTFRLRANAKYNDGQPVKASDFAYAWRRLIDPRSAAPFGPRFARAVKGGDAAASLGPKADAATVEASLDRLGLAAPDDRTFVVTLAQPLGYFEWIATLAQGAPVRKDVVDRFGQDTWATKVDTLITNGPFKVSDIGSDTTTFVANRNYWEPVKLQKIVAYYGLDPSARWTKYLNGEIDISNGPPAASQDAVRADPNFTKELVKFPELSNNWLEFNTKKPPFDNPKVRLAFAQAIDREAYLKVATNLMAHTLTSLIPEGLPGYQGAQGGAQQFDPAKAKAALAAAGVTPEQIGTVDILTFAFQERDAVFIKDQLEKNLGISANVTSLSDGGAVTSRVKQGNFTLKTTFLGHAANYPDPQSFFGVMLSTSPDNLTGWSNPDYDRLVTQADTTVDPAARQKLYDEAQSLLVEQAPVAFLAQPLRSYFLKPWVQGITRTAVDSAWMPGDLYSKTLVIGKH